MKPLPRREPKSERKMRREKGAARGRLEREEEKVRTRTWGEEGIYLNDSEFLVIRPHLHFVSFTYKKFILACWEI